MDAEKNPLTGRSDRGRAIYVRSLRDLSDDQTFCARSIKRIERRPRKGAPPEQWFRVTFYADRVCAKLLAARTSLEPCVAKALAAFKEGR